MATGPTIQDWNFTWHKKGEQDVHFEPSDEDRTNATYNYYGYLSAGGAWIIMRWDKSVTDTATYRYAAGQDGYAAAWTAKSTQTYGYFNAISPV